MNPLEDPGLEQPRSWFENPRLSFESLTPGQRYTTAITVGLAVAMMLFGMGGAGNATDELVIQPRRAAVEAGLVPEAELTVGAAPAAAGTDAAFADAATAAPTLGEEPPATFGSEPDTDAPTFSDPPASEGAPSPPPSDQPAQPAPSEPAPKPALPVPVPVPGLG